MQRCKSVRQVPGGGWRDVKCKGAKVRDSAQWDNGEGELKGGSRGRPDSWLGSYVRSINPGLRFPFELLLSLLARTRDPGQIARGPGILEIEASSDAVDVEDFAREMKPSAFPTFHGLEVDL